MRASDFRRIVLGMEGAVEGAHMGHPDFRVNNRIFASLPHDMEFGMVTLTPDQQEQFTRTHPDAFTPESGRNAGRGGDARLAEHGDQGCVQVNTQTIGETGSAIKETLSLKG